MIGIGIVLRKSRSPFRHLPPTIFRFRFDYEKEFDLASVNMRKKALDVDGGAMIDFFRTC